MKGKLVTISSASAIVILLLSISLVFAWNPPSETHPADAMWIEPSNVDLSADTHSVGYKFNVTVYLNVTTDSAFLVQIALLYNRTQLKATRARVTSPPTSEFMEGHSTAVTGPVIDTSYLGNGSVLVAESLYAPDKIDPPRCASLIWVEFEVVAVPPEGGNLTSTIDITTRFPLRTWVKNPEGINILDSTYNSIYFIPEFSSALILAIFMCLTVIAVIFAVDLRKFKVDKNKS